MHPERACGEALEALCGACEADPEADSLQRELLNKLGRIRESDHYKRNSQFKIYGLSFPSYILFSLLGGGNPPPPIVLPPPSQTGGVLLPSGVLGVAPQ